MMSIEIRKINHDDPALREQVYAFLAPSEPHALFILGNLAGGFPGSHLYVACEGAEWRGIAGYYDRPRSLIPFSREPDIVRALVRHVAARHSPIAFMNGIDYVAEPAYAELLAMGFEPDNDPHQVFMELDHAPPPQAQEPLARPMREDELAETVRLLRLLRGRPDPDAPASQADLDRLRLDLAHRYVLAADGRVVATASTNGIGIRAFQILGVVTHPEHRRRGYARAVCAALIRAMMSRGARQTVIFTDCDNVPAQRCYAGLGFRAAGRYYVAKFKERPRE